MHTSMTPVEDFRVLRATLGIKALGPHSLGKAGIVLEAEGSNI